MKYAYVATLWLGCCGMVEVVEGAGGPWQFLPRREKIKRGVACVSTTAILATTLVAAYSMWVPPLHMPTGISDVVGQIGYRYVAVFQIGVSMAINWVILSYLHTDFGKYLTESNKLRAGRADSRSEDRRAQIVAQKYFLCPGSMIGGVCLYVRGTHPWDGIVMAGVGLYSLLATQ